jgi:hypothetical protein
LNSLDEAEEDGDNSLRPGRTSPALSVAGSMTASADARRLQGRIIYELELVFNIKIYGDKISNKAHIYIFQSSN